MADMALATACEKARRLFDPHEYNVFELDGLFYVGRFLDDGWGRDHIGRRVRLAPYHRKEEIFGCGPTLRDAFRFCDGGPVISIPGITMGPRGARGMVAVKDKRARIVGFVSPAGVFSRHFPGVMQ